MKIIRARFENFRLLRDLEVNFSIDPDRKLTVIRAENESGKTTMLTGLQWGLYGDIALPGKANDFRLHPIDWEGSGDSVTVSVEIDLELVHFRPTRSGEIPQRRTYRIIRTARETPMGNSWERTPSELRMFHLEEKGAVTVQFPERLIAEEWPPELREVFFTDGDRALNFIEADTTSKRDRVQKAIRSLLALEVIESAQNHVQKTARSVNGKAKNLGGDSQLEGVASRLNQIVEEIDSHTETVADAKNQLEELSIRLNETRKNIDNALVKGDKAKLKNDLAQARASLKRIEEDRKKTATEHSNTLRSFELSRDLLIVSLEESLAMLDALRAQGDFPKTAIPVLVDRLNAMECICGASLASEDPEGQHKRTHIENLIEQTRKSDELQTILTELYFASSNLQLETSDGERWIDQSTRVVDKRDELEHAKVAVGERISGLIAQIDQLDDVDIEGLRSHERQLASMISGQRDRRVRSETQLEVLQRNRTKLMELERKLLRREERGARIIAEQNVVNDIQQALSRAYQRMAKEELAKVSSLMNKFFLDMIGADPDYRSIVRKAGINDRFDILVYGSMDRPLDPDRDLNGAARRALTLAFILALTKVSEAEAPNVIDTPLGMMSGYVKRAVLTNAIQESSQLVLFLTRSEISDCEDILDRNAGQVMTLTNPAHYPIMLENEPNTGVATIVRCDCNHRQECRICKRRRDVEVATV